MDNSFAVSAEKRNATDQPPAAETPGEPAGPNRRSVASDGSDETNSVSSGTPSTKTFYVWGDDKCKSRIEAASPQEAAKKLVDYACNNRIPICHGVYVSEVGYPNDPNPNIYSTRELCRTIDRECLAGTYSRFEGPLSS